MAGKIHDNVKSIRHHIILDKVLYNFENSEMMKFSLPDTYQHALRLENANEVLGLPQIKKKKRSYKTFRYKKRWLR